jgi:hypothetical protein
MTFVLIATNSKQVRQNAHELLAIAISTPYGYLSYPIYPGIAIYIHQFTGSKASAIHVVSFRSCDRPVAIIRSYGLDIVISLRVPVMLWTRFLLPLLFCIFGLHFQPTPVQAFSCEDDLEIFQDNTAKWDDLCPPGSLVNNVVCSM